MLKLELEQIIMRYESYHVDEDTILIELLASSKEEYRDARSFLIDAVRYLDNVIYPSYGVKEEYDNYILRDGDYLNIVIERLSLAYQMTDLNMDEIQVIRRIKKQIFDSLVEEYLIETQDDYILFIWTVAE